MENNEESFNVYNISYENKLLPKEIQKVYLSYDMENKI